MKISFTENMKTGDSMDIKNLLKILSKGFDISKALTKDDDTKSILIGISAIFAVLISLVKLFENYRSFKRIFMLKKN